MWTVLLPPVFLGAPQNDGRCMRCEGVVRFQEGTGAPTAHKGNALVLTTDVLTQLPASWKKRC